MESLLVFIIAVVVVVGLAWMLNPRAVRVNVDGFSEEEVAVHPLVSAEEQRVSDEMRLRPKLDPTTGLMVDGPGYESSEVEGAPEVPVSVPSNYYLLDDGAGGEMSIQNNLCSKSCCSAQWPTPFKMKYDPYVCQNKDKFVPSRYFCNNSFQDSGCLCLTKKQAGFLYNRGGNGREWF